jgi:hypothetical protein
MPTNRLLTLALGGWPCTVLIAFAGRSALGVQGVSLTELAAWVACAWVPVALMSAGAFLVAPRELSPNNVVVDARREQSAR